MIGRIVARLSGTLAGWRKTLNGIDPAETERIRTVRKNIAYYERELAHFQELARKNG